MPALFLNSLIGAQRVVYLLIYNTRKEREKGVKKHKKEIVSYCTHAFNTSGFQSLDPTQNQFRLPSLS